MRNRFTMFCTAVAIATLFVMPVSANEKEHHEHGESGHDGAQTEQFTSSKPGGHEAAGCRKQVNKALRNRCAQLPITTDVA